MCDMTVSRKRLVLVFVIAIIFYGMITYEAFASLNQYKENHNTDDRVVMKTKIIAGVFTAIGGLIIPMSLFIAVKSQR